MNEHRQPITDEDLVLLFYGEHDNPALAAAVAASEALSARYEALCRELKLADAYVPPPRGEAYGAKVWQRISSRLDDRRSPALARAPGWLPALIQPRFSLAGGLALLLVAVVAFTLGRQNGTENRGPESPDARVSHAGVEVLPPANIDPGRLLNHSVSAHLEQVNRMLTRFVNSNEPNASDAADATDLLVSNRIYRRSALASGDARLAAFLGDIEPLLIELAYEAQAGSPSRRERMQQEIKDGLLFRVRMMNSQLSADQIST